MAADGDRALFFFDEGRFGAKPCVARFWAERGKRAHTAVNPGYSNFYLYSAVCPATGDGFTLFLPEVNTAMMNLYLAALSERYADRKILIVMDQAGWHKAKRLVMPANIIVEYLPPYSPELNPVERLWQWLRRHACRNRMFETLDDIADTLQETIRQLASSDFMSICRCGYLLQ